MISKLTEVW